MSNQSENFTVAIEHFSSEQEETRAAAAFAAGNEFICYLLDVPLSIASWFPGNIAIGNLHQFLPAIIKIIENDPKKRLLALHAAKEVGFPTHGSQCLAPDSMSSRSLPIARTANLKVSRTFFGVLSLRTPRMQKNLPEMSQLPALESWPPPILHDIYHNFMYGNILMFPFVRCFTDWLWIPILGSHQGSQPRFSSYCGFRHSLYVRGNFTDIRRCFLAAPCRLLIAYG
jgi:hypothetical protein